jgi:hypothetical protein
VLRIRIWWDIDFMPDLVFREVRFVTGSGFFRGPDPFVSGQKMNLPKKKTAG